jgi:hypothetical protein
MTDPSEGRRILRRIFPKKSTCPECGKTGHRHNGNSRGGLIQYRRCKNCRADYRVVSCGQEEDRGGLTSVLVLW